LIFDYFYQGSVASASDLPDQKAGEFKIAGEVGRWAF